VRRRRRRGKARGIGAARRQPEAAQRLDAVQVAVLGQDAEHGGGGVHADGVEPAAAHADACSEGGGAGRRLGERDSGSSEEPHEIVVSRDHTRARGEI